MMALIALALIVFAALIQIVFLLFRENRRDPVSHWFLGAGGILLLATLVDRSIAIRFVAVTDLYESLLFFSAAICIVLFILRQVRSTRGLSPFVLFGSTVVAIALLAISSSPAAPKEIVPPIPALRSWWLVLHVTFAFVGESFFVVSFVAAIAYLATKNEDRRADIDRLVATSIGIGYPIFSAGALVFGAIWADTAWGTWWSWDPKETWSLVTWLLYTAYLHTRLVKTMRGRTSAILAIVGFAAAVFTFFDFEGEEGRLQYVTQDPIKLDQLKKENKAGYLVFLPLKTEDFDGEVGIGMDKDGKMTVVRVHPDKKGADLLNKSLSRFRGLGKKGQKEPFKIGGGKSMEKLADDLFPVYLRAMETVTMYDRDESERTWADD